VSRDSRAIETAEGLIRQGLAALDTPFSEDQVKRFLTYLAELKKWSRAYNLTGLKNDRDIIIKHFLDSLLFLKVIPPSAVTAADVGSGAGFPGIPVKIFLPLLKIFLIEPVGKKAIFLRHISKRLALDGIEIVDKRIEEAGGLKVDVAMTRALFTVGDFIEKTRGHINKGGVLILSKGPKLREELEGLEMRDITVSDHNLPLEETVRHLVVVRV
jgi:16S rRNA (guanine527-N7)-methyltransferase